MPETNGNAEEFVIGGQEASQAEARPSYGHGKLKRITGKFFKWKDKDANGNKIEGTGGEVKHAAWLKLPEEKRGQKWIFTIDNSVINPKFENPTVRGVMLGFPEWQNIYLPGIQDAVGGDKPVFTLAERAKEETWYVEYILVPNGEVSLDGKAYTGMRFTRMTQDLSECLAWNAERYPKKEEQVPQDIMELAESTWKSSIVQKAPDRVAKFTTLLSSNEDASPWLAQLNKWASEQ